MHGEERAVKENLAVARHANGGEILDLEIAHLVGLVLDVDPAEAGVRKLRREREESRLVLGARIAPSGAKAAHFDHD